MRRDLPRGALSFMNTKRSMLRPFFACSIVAGVAWATAGVLGCDGLLGVDFNNARPGPNVDAAPDADDLDPERAGGGSGLLPGAPAGYVLVTLDETQGGPQTDHDAASPPDPLLVLSVDVFGSSPLATLSAGECVADVAPKVPASPRPASAFTVKVSGNLLPPLGIEVDHGSPFEAGDRGWVGGAYFNFFAVGSMSIPGFSRSNVEAPPNVTITRPEFESDGALTVDRSVALLTDWTGGGPGRVEVTLTSSEPAASRQTVVRCSFRARDNHGFVPSKHLALLQQAGNPGVTGTYSIRPTNLVEFGVGTWTVGIALNGVRTSGPLRVSK